MTTLTPGITVCIPTIPPRFDEFHRALKTVMIAAESVPSGVPVRVSSIIDTEKRGAAATRQACLEQVTTKWVAFLDDDDTMDPWHLRELYLAAREHGADYLWSQFRIGLPGGQTRPGPDPLGAGSFDQWNDDQPAQTTVTTLVRTELAKDVGGFQQQPSSDHWTGPEHPEGLRQAAEQATGPSGEIDGQRAGEDWLFTLACRAAGGVFRHVPKVTWTWNHWGGNTSGLPSRW